ncbi:MAG: HlyD family efflux transporter periplasmic adaptor subunit [Bacteroidaceae bacterium]|nr:HlyD family efflux transporter periplasmic adaptor subunit [Bacteroidaceae bacterium]
MKRTHLLMSTALLLTACTKQVAEYDATGTFEATEVTVCAESAGILLRFTSVEGQPLTAGDEVALVDTTQIVLQMAQLRATQMVYDSQQPNHRKQVAALRERLAAAQREQKRYEELVADGAAPRKMLDDATTQADVLHREIDALESSLGTQTATLRSQREAAEAQIKVLADRLDKCRVMAPRDGIVLETYAEPGEYVTTGKPLLTMADTDEMYLRAYVTTGQLERLHLGQKVTVYADYGNGQRKEYPGTLAWISQRSEFTPKTILTDDERADLVYATKIRVPNDGLLKIGMYGEVKFESKEP